MLQAQQIITTIQLVIVLKYLDYYDLERDFEKGKLIFSPWFQQYFILLILALGRKQILH